MAAFTGTASRNRRISKTRGLKRVDRMKERNPARLERPPLDQNHAEEEAPDAVLKGDPVQFVHPSVEHLHGPEEVAYEADELVVVCLVRDGRPYVKSFVEHYLSMGTKHLFFLDNGSTDGTVEVLKEYDTVTVLRSTLPFKRYQVPMRQYLVERFGRGRWCLCVDIDELFDYPYSDVVSLSSFLSYLNSNSYTAVAAQMLDMFPEEPLSEAASGDDDSLKERHRFYDISNIRRTSVEERSPLRNNTYEIDGIEAFFGGIRETIFGFTPYLTKHPLVLVDDRTKPVDGTLHWVDNARVADLTCVLFHYKFLDEYFHKQAVRAVREKSYFKNSSEYTKYLEVLEKTPNLLVKGESTRELESVNELVENLFLVVSKEYMLLVYDEERKKGAGHAALLGEPGAGGPEDEAAFYKAKVEAEAEAKVQSLRALRLERHLEQLREQHQREAEQLREQHQRRIEKLQGQYQKRIEKLGRRLARIKKQNRLLENQLQSVQVSRSRRLLAKLGRIWAKVLGRKR